MRCPQCQHENPTTATFCGECGFMLERRCPRCDAANPATNKFCQGCGQSLTVVPGTPADRGQPPAQRGPAEAERRQLTVMFCDLVGSTALSARLDPEEWRDVVRAYQTACAEVIARFGGHIAQYLGDGLLVYFGYPQAHDDDANRAVRSALGVVAAARGLGAQRHGREGPLAVRVGIHTGLVVVGEVGAGASHEQLALGETPNVAARLQTLAEPDTVVVSETTHRLVRGLFVTLDLGAHSLKGVPTPMRAYRVLGESEARSRFDAAAVAGLTRLVGREQEVDLLLDRWERAREGQGHVVLLNGEAGIGKSRLVQVLKARLADSPHQLAECRCSPYDGDTPLYPVTDLLPLVFGWNGDDSVDSKLGKLEQHLAQYEVPLADTVPLLASLLSLPVPDRYSLPPMSPERHRRRTIDAVLALLLATAARQPVLLIVEDLHWVDPSTIEFLTLLLDQVPTAPLFALFTTRPSFQAPWPARSHFMVLSLNRFTRRHTELMVSHVTGSKALPPEVVQQIAERTDGVPLFVEELTKTVLESGLVRDLGDHYELTGPLPPLAIPTTLRDSLMARLDRLASAKAVAQLAATLGRAFPYELLRAVTPLEEPMLQRELARLVEVELLYQRGVPPEATYVFKHALIQEAAYESLLKSARQQHHRRIAETLVERFPQTAEARPEYVAHHYSEAGLGAQAIGHWQRAGEQAIQRSANVEAIRHLTKALEAVTTLPDSTARTQQELLLQITLAPAWIAVKGYAAPEVVQIYTRAYDLCQQLDNPPQLPTVLVGLWLFSLLRVELDKARQLGERLLSLGHHKRDPVILLSAHYALGNTLAFRGELGPAREHLEQCIALYDPRAHRRLAFLYGDDPRVACLHFKAWCLWYQGYPDQARQCIDETVAVARELGHPQVLAFALCGVAVVEHLRRDRQLTRQHAEAAIELCREQGLPVYLALARALWGWALVEEGRAAEGIAEMREALRAYRSTRVRWMEPYLLALLAEAHGNAGQPDDGLRVMAEAIDLIRETQECAWEAELYRIEGELLLKSGSPRARQDAEERFQRAIDTARQQEARSWELRAAMSLGRLWHGQGKRDAARQLLTQVYDWFTEGFDTVDVRAANSMLRELEP
jgi:class 3 adenylate cyclase/predicted ATPase